MGSTSRSITRRWVSLGDFLYICIVIIHFSLFFLFILWTCHFDVIFSLWKMSSESEVFVGFADGASRHTRRLSSTAWVIFTLQGQFLYSGGICLGDTTNNVIKYSAVIELFHDALSHGISHLRVHLDAQLVVSLLNGFYRIHDSTLHQRFLRVSLRTFLWLHYIYPCS